MRMTSGVCWGYCVLVLVVAAIGGCITTQTLRPPAITLQQIEDLRSIESLLPLAPDSVVKRYERYEGESFNWTFATKMHFMLGLIDSLNEGIDKRYRIDTLAIDHTFENFGTAARSGRTLFVSSSYFYIFDNVVVLRSVVMHEFGHVHYLMLSDKERERMEAIWSRFRGSALFYLFIDGEYSGNARFGGHPEESSAELFASAYNLMNDRWEELRARMSFVDSQNLGMIDDLRKIVLRSR